MSGDVSDDASMEGAGYPLFVTANLPVEVINSFLFRAMEERWENNDPSSERVGNPWVLIQTRDQESFAEPTIPPVEPSESGFIGATIEELSNFVETTFGDDGRGHYIQNDRFGVLDARTREDNTLEFVVKEGLSPLDLAQLRIIDGNYTRHDEAMVRYSERKATQEDLAVLVHQIRDIPQHSSDQQPLETEVSEEDITTFRKLFIKQNVGSNMWETLNDEWVRVRLDVATAGQNTAGIYQIGPLAFLQLPQGS
ncbi:hypothetical protein BU16DRAFT_544402 [Lophium mytilinum]|uniref:Uncharacterized protein n=1 Tax=Lophium mytilinum TaxID=390894 RepID=A0A6A6QC97_9PEZI|nr:hypothetical protein BU16DRAFT_544402 [Lophium mytilinum]